MKMSSLVISTLVTVLVFGGCRARNLTRNEAKRLITSSEKFTAPATREILLGPDIRKGMGGFLNDLMGTYDYELAECLGADTEVGSLEGQGILARSSNGEVVLTDKGREAERDWLKDPERPNARGVPVAQAELLEVSGIVQEEGSTDAEVHFNWRWKWTPLMTRLDFGDWAGCTPDAMIKALGYDATTHTTTQEFTARDGTALLRRYDDGWRVETVEAR